MVYSLKQAAEAVGKSKPTILRAIQKGKISARRHEITQDWEIEPVELHRLYPPIRRNCNELLQNDAPHNYAMVESALETAPNHQEIKVLRELLGEREKRILERDEVILDLKNRLTQESEDRRRAQTQLTALLSAPQDPGRSNWWQWWKFRQQKTTRKNGR